MIVIKPEYQKHIWKGDIDLFGGKLKLQTKDITNLSAQHPMQRAASKKVHLYKLSFDPPVPEVDSVMHIKELLYSRYLGYEDLEMYFKIEETTDSNVFGAKMMNKETVKEFIEQYNKE